MVASPLPERVPSIEVDDLSDGLSVGYSVTDEDVIEHVCRHLVDESVLLGCWHPGKVGGGSEVRLDHIEHRSGQLAFVEVACEDNHRIWVGGLDALDEFLRVYREFAVMRLRKCHPHRQFATAPRATTGPYSAEDGCHCA